MALTVAHTAEAPGKAGARPLFHFGPRPVAVWTGTIAFDDSYPTGGESLDFTSAGLDVFREVILVKFENKSGYSFEYDYSNKKVKAFKDSKRLTAAVDPGSLATDAVEDRAVAVTGVATTDDVVVIPPATLEAGLVYQTATVTGAGTVTVRVSNTSAGTVDGASKTATFLVRPQSGAGVEVADTTDLAAITGLRCVAYGYR